MPPALMDLVVLFVQYIISNDFEMSSFLIKEGFSNVPSKTVTWVISRGISVREAAEWAGFNIDSLNQFSKSSQLELRAKIINSIIRGLDEEWYEQVANKGGLSSE
jgi:hypothetical protein